MSLRSSVVARHHVVQHGEGRCTLVFAPGFGGGPDVWRLVEPAFRDRFRTVLFDAVGFGASDRAAFRADRYATLDGHARDLAEIAEALELRDAVVVGHSASAMIALLASLRAVGRIGALVMIAPSPRMLNDRPHYIGGFERAHVDDLLALLERSPTAWAGAFAPLVMGNPERPQLTAELREALCAIDPAVAACFARAAFYADHRADLARAQVPSLVLQVRDDGMAPMAVGAYVERHLPRSERVLIEASGHCPHLSHPSLTRAALRPFLERRLAAARSSPVR
jgi:sigma-B regulation protein RsbQ